MDFDNRKVYGDTSITDGLVRFDLNKLNIDYGSEGNSPWYSTPSPSPHETFAEIQLPPSTSRASKSPSHAFSSSPKSSSTSATSSPWDRLQDLEEPLPHNFKENAFSNLAVRFGKLDVREEEPILLPAVPAVPGKQSVEYTFRRARAKPAPVPSSPINAYMGIPGWKESDLAATNCDQSAIGWWRWKSRFLNTSYNFAPKRKMLNSLTWIWLSLRCIQCMFMHLLCNIQVRNEKKVDISSSEIENQNCQHPTHEICQFREAICHHSFSKK